MLTVLNTARDPFYNLAFEEYVFRTFRDDDVLLLWQNAPAVVVGSYQNICREVHVESLRRLGIPVLRRMTGGGTVYHDAGNLNYTLITDQTGYVDYDRSLAPMLAALRSLGLPAEKGGVCDITVAGRKISGSAQRGAGGRLLHHGTLLFESDLGMLDRITTHHKNDCFRTKGTLSAICTVTNIRDHLAEPMTMREFETRLLDLLLPPGSPRLTLTWEQEREVLRLRDETYRSWAWTWGRTPAFTYEKSGVFDGAPIRVAYAAKGGILSDAAVESPRIDGAETARLLSGGRLDPERFAAICRRVAGDRAEALMDWLL